MINYLDEEIRRAHDKIEALETELKKTQKALTTLVRHLSESADYVEVYKMVETRKQKNG